MQVGGDTGGRGRRWAGTQEGQDWSEKAEVVAGKASVWDQGGKGGRKTENISYKVSRLIPYFGGELEYTERNWMRPKYLQAQQR